MRTSENEDLTQFNLVQKSIVFGDTKVINFFLNIYVNNRIYVKFAIRKAFRLRNPNLILQRASPPVICKHLKLYNVFVHRHIRYLIHNF